MREAPEQWDEFDMQDETSIRAPYPADDGSTLPWPPRRCGLEDLSDIEGRLLPQSILRITLRGEGRLGSQTRACLVNLVRLRDKGVGDWQRCRRGVLDYLEANKTAHGRNITIEGWHHLITATDRFEDALDAAHRGADFAKAIRELHGEELPDLPWPSRNQRTRMSKMRNELQHRDSDIMSGKHAADAPFTLLLENERAVVGSKQLRYDDLADALCRLSDVSVELVKRV